MLNGFDTSLEERLKLAEQAEMEMTRLQPLASEAPTLRAEKSRAKKAAERHRARTVAIEQAQQSADGALEKLAQVPELLGIAARAVNNLYGALKETESRRQEAMKSLAIADRVDYDIELEEGEETERSLDRDPRGLAYAIAGRHGDVRVKKLLDDLQPGFNLLGGCNMDDPLYRDVASFVMQRITPAVPLQAAAANKKPNVQPIMPPPNAREDGAPEAIPAFLSESDQD